MAAGKVAHHVGSTCRNLHGVAEDHRLPAAGSLVGECRGGELGAGAGPQGSDVGAAVAEALVELHADDRAGLGRAEPHADIDEPVVPVGENGRHFRWRKQAGQLRRRDRDVDAGSGRFEVDAVVDRARLDVVGAAGKRRERVAPILEAACTAPGGAAIRRHFDHGHQAAAAVGCRAADDNRLSRGVAAARCRRRHHADRCGMVGGLRGRHKARHQGGWLDAHFGEQVDHRLLDVRVGRRCLVVVVGIETPRPVDRACAEDEGAARRAIHGQGVGGGARTRRVAVVEQKRVHVNRRRRQVDQASRPRAVVEVGIPLIAKKVLLQRVDLSGLEIGHRRIAPEAEIGHVVWNGDGVETVGIDGEDGSRQPVLRLSGPEFGIAPCRRGVARIGIRVVPAFLVGHHRLVGRTSAVDARFPTHLPIDFVAAQEGEVDAGVARGLYVVALLRRPVLVVADRHEDLAVQQLRAGTVGVDAGDVVDVVAVLLEPADRRIFDGEDEVLRASREAAVTRDDRAVVADGARASGVAGRIDTAIEIVAAPPVIGLPGRVRSLESDVARRFVVAHDEGDHVGPARTVETGQLGDIDARYRIRRNIPGCRDRPVAGVDQLADRVEQRIGLDLRAGQRLVDGGDLAGAVAAIVAQTVDIDAIVGRVGVDLEVDPLAVIERKLDGEAFDRRIGGVDQPLAFRRALLLVFQHDRVGWAAQRGDAGAGTAGRGYVQILRVERRKTAADRRRVGRVVILQDTRRITRRLAVRCGRTANADRAYRAGAPRAGSACHRGTRRAPVRIPAGNRGDGRTVEYRGGRCVGRCAGALR